MEAAPPGEKAGGVQFANLAVEDLVLVRREDAGQGSPDSASGRFAINLGEKLEPDKEAMEWVRRAARRRGGRGSLGRSSLSRSR